MGDSELKTVKWEKKCRERIKNGENRGGREDWEDEVKRQREQGEKRGNAG